MDSTIIVPLTYQNSGYSPFVQRRPSVKYPSGLMGIYVYVPLNLGNSVVEESKFSGLWS